MNPTSDEKPFEIQAYQGGEVEDEGVPYPREGLSHHRQPEGDL